MRTHLKLILVGIALFLSPVTAINPLGGSFQQLLEAQSKLGDHIKHHEAHVEGPYTKALLDEMKAVSIQISDVMEELGCRDDKQDEICVILWMQKLGLESQIVVEGTKWYDYAQGMVMEGIVMEGMANRGEQKGGKQKGGKVVFKKVVREGAGPE